MGSNGAFVALGEGLGDGSDTTDGDISTEGKGELAVAKSWGDDDGDGIFGESTLVGEDDGLFGIENEIKSAKIDTDPTAFPHRRFMECCD